MANDLVSATIRGYRIPGEAEMATVIGLLREFQEFVTWRNNFAQQWEEAAALIEVNSRNTFYYNNFNWPGAKKADQQIDASGAIALERFVAIADSLVTPKGQLWHGLEAGADYDYLMKDRATRLWYEAATKRVFQFRYAALANFASQNSAIWRSLGAFGNATMFIDKLDGSHFRQSKGVRYKAVPLGECFFGENHQGAVDRIFRWFKLTAAQAAQKWGRENLPQQLLTAYEKNSLWSFNFLHVVKPRGDDYDPERLDARGMAFSSHFVSLEGQCLMQPEGGFRVFPYAVSRYAQGPNEIYGRGPAQIVLPSLKTLNAQKKVFLKQGHRAADPVLLLGDDGIVGDLRPGAKNYGAMTQDGKRLIDILPTGDIQISEKMMGEERSIIDDIFLVSLFKVLSEHPNMTATQVIELVSEKGMLVGPTMGRQHSEYVGAGMVPRELDLLAEQGLLPEMPPLLREARGQYEVSDTSPLSKLRRAGEAAGFLRTVEVAREIVNITQDTSYLDPFDFDTALPEIADINGSPFRWMADGKAIAQKRQNRAQAQQRQEAIQAAPAQAAMIKARAVVAEKAPAMLGQPVPA